MIPKPVRDRHVLNLLLFVLDGHLILKAVAARLDQAGSAEPHDLISDLAS